MASLEPWDEVWRRNQYVIDGLLRADRELEVLFIEPAADPLFALSSGRRASRGRGLRSADGYDGRLRLYEPTKALPRRAGSIADRLVTAGIRRAVSRLGWRDGLLWVNDPGQSALVDVFGWPSLYDMTDDWVAADRGAREHERIVAGDAELMRRCDEVVVCSTGLSDLKGGERAVRLIPNAVDVDRYRRPHPRPSDLPDGPGGPLSSTASTAVRSARWSGRPLRRNSARGSTRRRPGGSNRGCHRERDRHAAGP